MESKTISKGLVTGVTEQKGKFGDYFKLQVTDKEGYIYKANNKEKIEFGSKVNVCLKSGRYETKVKFEKIEI